MKKIILGIAGIALALTIGFYSGTPVEKGAATVTTNTLPGPGGGVGGD